MLIEIVEGRDKIKEVRNKSMEIVALEQECYYHLPNSVYPAQGRIRVDRPLAPGHYEAQLPFMINRYQKLDINPFESPVMKPVPAPQKKVV